MAGGVSATSVGRRNATLPTNGDLQKAFPLLSCLQPDRAVAVCVLIDAYDRVDVVRRGQERRPDADRPYKLIIPEENLPQYCIYQVSEKWEMDQESDCPGMEPYYRPTTNDRVTRYVKTLALESMNRHSRYAAVGVGCCLYTYRSKQISSLAEDLFNSENIRRDKKRMFKRLERRFPGICDGGGRVSLETPDERQRALVNKSLSVLAPWYSCHAACVSGPETTFLETCFEKDSRRPELERIHVLFDTACCGLARLVREYNSSFPEGSKMRLDDPDNKLRVPKFGDAPAGPAAGEGEGGPPDPDERFNPSPLAPAELSSIRHILDRNQRRRRLYQAGELSVYVDGEATATLTRERASTSLIVPDTASCVEVFGNDDYGELLLAVFPLSCLEPDGAALTRELYVTHGGGPTFEISVSPVPAQSGDSPEILLRLEYGESREDAGSYTAPGAANVFVDEGSLAAEESLPGTNQAGGLKFPPHSRNPDKRVLSVEERAEITQQGVAFWSEAYVSHFEHLCAYARRFIGDAGTAEDIVQNVFLKILMLISDQELVADRLSYLRRSVHSASKDWLKKQKRFKTVSIEGSDVRELREMAAAEKDAEDDLETERRRLKIGSKLNRLNDHEREVLVLYLRGYTSQQIATKLNEDRRVIRCALNSARVKIRRRLAQKKKGWE